MKNCLKCEYHEIIRDPDPHDWFCDDDMAVICKKMKNDEINESSLYQSDRLGFKCITKSSRPYNIEKESVTPKWCPLKINNIK